MIIQTHEQVESPQLTAVKDKLLTLSAKSVSGFKRFHEELREAMAERKTMKGLKHSEVREAKRFGDWIYYRGMRNPAIFPEMTKNPGAAFHELEALGAKNRGELTEDYTFKAMERYLASHNLDYAAKSIRRGIPNPGIPGVLMLIQNPKDSSYPHFDRFARGSGVYTCRLCGKRTRQTDPDSAGVGLCGKCYEHAGWENYHSDSGHKSHPDPKCPICKELGLVKNPKKKRERYIPTTQEILHPPHELTPEAVERIIARLKAKGFPGFSEKSTGKETKNPKKGKRNPKKGNLAAWTVLAALVGLGAWYLFKKQETTLTLVENPNANT